MRDIVRSYVRSALSDVKAVLVIGEAGFLRKSKPFCDVGRHHTG
ncbi:hypothetical protein GMO_17770 [Gluconobacter morbifer G707]|uniref:Uncharacterized protein n=1 Tax=Gluconobacter morbifer G707 TaxID=1088869 RepID=G6XK48_9PROT|nr:hypothetical protein GMO_17770 [Gluconobacter morbifer G707]